MHVRQLKLENYRGFSQLVLDLDPQLTVLVGGNGAGKTAVLEALRAGAASHPPENFMGTDLRLGCDSGFIKIYTDDPDRFVNVQRTGGTTHASGHSPRKFTVFYDAHRYVTIDASQEHFRRDWNFRDAVNGAMTGPLQKFDEFVDWFRATEDLENEKRIKNSAYRHPQLEAVRAAVAKLMPEFSELRVERAPQRLMVDKGGQSLELRQLSGGERLLVGLAADLSRRLAMVGSPKIDDTIVLIDEVELHLHPKWQREVLARLLAAFPQCQFVVTTHSPQVLSTVRAHQIRVLKEGGVFVPSLPTEGKNSDALLEDLMGVSARPEGMQAALAQVAHLIDAERWEEAKTALHNLEEKLGAHDASVTHLRSLMAFLVK